MAINANDKWPYMAIQNGNDKWPLMAIRMANSGNAEWQWQWPQWQ